MKIFNVFKKKPSKEFAAAEVASGIISVQLALGSSDLPAISGSRDHLALGYVFGFHDAVCQAMDIPASSPEGILVLLDSFTQLAGTAGSRILEECLALQSDPEFLTGMKIGGTEAFQFMREHKPVVWLSSHLQQREKAP